MAWAFVGRMGLDIRQITGTEGDPSGFRTLVDVFQADMAERDPGDPLPGPVEIAGRMFSVNPGQTRIILVAEKAGQPAAMAYGSTISEPSDENQVGYVEILVKPEYRRRGVASALLAEIVPRLQDLGQNSIMADVCSSVAHEAAAGFCQRYGLTARMEERCSRALVADIDTQLMNDWIAAAVTSAPGYRIEQFEGPCPAHLAEWWCAAVAGMEDMPLDDLDWNPFTRSVEEQREGDEIRHAAGIRMYRSLAVSADGEAAGMSAIHLHVDRPEVAQQDDTAVLEAHRGRRIGRWLKAANYQFTRSAQPEIAVIETYNAQSNPWMLDINVAMGFRPHHIYTGYQGSIETMASVLAGRS